MAGELSIFADSRGTQHLATLDFKTVKVGTPRTMTVFLKNSSPKWPIQKIRVASSQLQGLQVDHPKKLDPGEIAPVQITWTPSLNIDEPLDVDSFFEGELLMKRMV